MTILQAFWFGLVQGLTEFLPISSSGHLVLMEKLFDISSDSLALEVLLHIGTLAAIAVVYWREIIRIFKEPFLTRRPFRSDMWRLILATIPTVIAGLAVEDFSAAFKFNIIGWGLLLTTIILWFGDLVSSVAEKRRDVKWYNALAMGMIQAVAILPGISRSGSTISMGVATGLSRRSAADFSFLMAMPVILGSIVLMLPKMAGASQDALIAESPTALLVAVATSFVVGLISIKVLLKIIRRIRISWFGAYTGILGALILMDQYFFHFFFN